MNKEKNNSKYLFCESKLVYLLLMCSAGMMGAYTFNLRGGVFCNAQTANFVMMAIAFGKGNISHGFYFLIPITAYFLGAFISESLPSPIKKLGFLRWDTYLIAFEIIILFIMGLIPLTLPNQIVQVSINFIASMQYNTFRQAEGIPMSTTFCTNHLRQIGIAMSRIIRKKDYTLLNKCLTHLCMLFFFVIGGFILTFACSFLVEKSIWLAIIPLLITLAIFIYGDTYKEHDLLYRKPAGH